MSSITRVALCRPFTRAIKPSLAVAPRRFASDYGSIQGGQEQGINQKNPMSHLEHPGPDAPSVSKDSGSSNGSESNAASSPDSSSSSGSSSKAEPKPKISSPKPAPESQNTDVKQHNQEMANRSEKTTEPAQRT